MEYKLNLPCTDVTHLSVGDTVLLSGTIYTARDAGHGRLLEMIEKGEALPFTLDGNGIYYVGPTPERPGEIIGSAGPTTSGRMDSFAPYLLDLGLKVMVGKGRRSETVTQSIVKNKAVYLAAVGGAGALMANGIKSAELICWDDLGCEALRKLTIDNLPLTVVIDSTGRDLYAEGPKDYLNSISQ
ncbi:MAG: Fe-S-containing hydro-lyase [Eubacteriales bacterium]